MTSGGQLAEGRVVQAQVYAGNKRDMACAVPGTPGASGSPARLSRDGWAINGCPDDGPALAVGAKRGWRPTNRPSIQ